MSWGGGGATPGANRLGRDGGGPTNKRQNDYMDSRMK